MEPQSDRDLAKAQLDRGELDAAIESCDRALLREPGDTNLLFWRGIALMRKGDYAPAAEDFSYVLQKCPDHNDTLYNRGYCLRRGGRPQEALQDFALLLQRQPDDAGALVQRGRCLVETKDPKGSLNDFERALQLKPDYAEASFMRAIALSDLGQYQPSVDEFNRTLQIDPNYLDVFFQRGWSKSRLNDLHGAIDDYTVYIKNIPNDPQGHTYRGYCHRDLNSYDRAIEDFRQAIALDGNRKNTLDPEIAKAQEMQRAQQQGIRRPNAFWKNFAFVWRILERMEYSGTIVIALVGAAIGVPLVFAVQAIRDNFRLTDPFIDIRGFLAVVGGLGVLALGAALVRIGGWKSEKRRVRIAILKHLRLSDDEAGIQKAQEQIRALVRCTGRSMYGRLAGLKGRRRLWLCFLRKRLLVVSVSSGQVLELPAEELQKIHLVEGQSTGNFQIAIEAGGGTSILGVRRLDDLVRIVNVLKENGVVLGYLDRGKRSPVPLAIAGLLIVGVVALWMKPEILSGLFRNEFSQHRLVRLQHHGAPALSPDGQSVTVRTWRGALERQELSFEHEKPIRLSNRTVADTEATMKEDAPPKEVVRAFRLSGDGTRSAIVREQGQIQILSSNSFRAFQDAEVYPQSLSLSHDGRRIMWATQDKVIKVMEVDTGGEVLKLPGENLVMRAAFSPDGLHLAFITDRREVRVWDLNTRRDLFLPVKFDDAGPLATGLAFSPDGKQLAVGGYRRIDLWDLTTRRELLTIKLKDEDGINEIAFRPDGNRLAAATRNQVVILDPRPGKAWQLADDREIQRLHGHVGYVVNLMYDNDGKRLYSASSTEAIRWE